MKSIRAFLSKIRILFSIHVRQAFEEASGSKWAKVLIKAMLYKQRLRRVPNMSKYGSIRLSKAWICVNVLQYVWISLNMPEIAWINCSDYASVFNMPRCSYNNTIIVGSNDMLEFLPARFMHPVARLPFYL